MEGCGRAEIMGLWLRSNEGLAEYDVDLHIQNPNSSPMDVMAIDLFVWDGDDDEVDAAAVAAAAADDDDDYDDYDDVVAVEKKRMISYAHRDEIPAESSKILKIPFNNVSHASAYTLKANVTLRQGICGVLQLSAEKVKHMVTRMMMGTAGSDVADGVAGEVVSGYVNGMHIVSISPSEVSLVFVLRVKNSNDVAVTLKYTNFIVEKSGSGKQLIESKRVECNAIVAAKSNERHSIPLVISTKEILDGNSEIDGGDVVKVVVKMEFCFKAATREDVYKISAHKIGTLPIPVQPSMKMMRVVFERQREGEGEVEGEREGEVQASVEFVVDNKNAFSFKLINLRYEIGLEEKDGGGKLGLIAKCEYEDGEGDGEGEGGGEVIMSGKSLMNMKLKAVPLDKAHFGSALWEVFSGSQTVFTAQMCLKGLTTDYGTFHA